MLSIEACTSLIGGHKVLASNTVHMLVNKRRIYRNGRYTQSQDWVQKFRSQDQPTVRIYSKCLLCLSSCLAEELANLDPRNVNQHRMKHCIRNNRIQLMFTLKCVWTRAYLHNNTSSVTEQILFYFDWLEVFWEIQPEAATSIHYIKHLTSICHLLYTRFNIKGVSTFAQLL